MRTLMWFREHDLRCRDNTALYFARQQASEGLATAFIISPEEWKKHDMAPCRMDFIMRQLNSLRAELQSLNIPLFILTAAKSAKIPVLLLQLAKRHRIDAFFYNEQYELDEKKRDATVTALFNKNTIAVHSYCDQVIFAPGEIRTQSGKFFTIFTPFKNAWLKKLQENGGVTVLPKPKKFEGNPLFASLMNSKTYKYKKNDKSHLWPVSEKYALARLKYFIKHKINHYHRDRDFPALDGTSSLSPYLTSGIISPRQCLQATLKNNSKGAQIWISELIWREFYKHILYAFPRVCMGKPFKSYTDKIPWRYDRKLFTQWKNGKTGIPIIDAAMRQLKQTGWMHNRLRMIVAMYLSKNLMVDWRWGEKYFMQQLIDGDFAANNGGWQWAASTGTDAAPYFRIFNPITQSQRFDANGKFIKYYCQEINHLSSKEIHDPNKLSAIINASRKKAIKLFQSLSS